VLYCGTSVVPCRVLEVISKLDKAGKELPGIVHLKGHNALGAFYLPPLHLPTLLLTHMCVVLLRSQ
jgi:hypothetical protein